MPHARRTHRTVAGRSVASPVATTPSFSAARAGRARRRAELRKRARPHLRPAGSAPADLDRMVLGGLNEGIWPPTRAAIPGSAARCGLTSVSICRSGASALPRTTSRRRSAPRRSSSRAPPSRAARPPSPPASCNGSAAVSVPNDGKRRAARGDYISRSAECARRARGKLRRSNGPSRGRRPRLARRILGHRYRELAARSLYDLRQARARAASARSDRHAARRRRPRQRDP